MIKIGRRKFLKHLTSFGALLFTGRYFKAFAQTSGDSRSASGAGPLLMKTIPKSGEKIPAVGLGTYQTFDVGPSAQDHAPLRKVLRLFYDMGGRVIDSSPMYGRSEAVIGSLSTELGLNEEFFMATKVWTRGKESGIRQMNESFEKMGVRQMDLMQIHNLVDWRTHLKTLREWKEAGKIRYLGITHYRADAFDDLEQIMKSEPLDFVQLNYSLAEPEADERLLPLARERGIAILANRPFAAGSMFGRVKGKSLPDWAEEIDCRSWAQFFLKYIISHPGVTCAIPATGNPEHLEDNMKAATGRMPDSEMRRRMAGYFHTL